MRISVSQFAAGLAGGAVLLIAVVHTSAQDALKSTAVNSESGFRFIEGPAVDKDGNLYFVHRVLKNGKSVGQISKLKPGAKKAEPFSELTDGRIGNGIRFDKEGRMYIADFKKNNVLVIENGQTKASVYFPTNGTSGPKFNQPNDLAIGNDGTIYASDPLRKGSTKTGQIWRIARGADGKVHGKVMTSDRKGAMGVTNGIDLSPDGKTLYVGESTTNQIWAYRIDGDKLFSLTGGDQPMTTVKGGGELDGLRTDVKGRIYVTHNGTGRISIVTPMSGDEPKVILTQKSAPTNLTFGGPDGKTLFITQAVDADNNKGFIESVVVDAPGREPCLQFKGAFCPP